MSTAISWDRPEARIAELSERRIAAEDQLRAASCARHCGRGAPADIDQVEAGQANVLRFRRSISAGVVTGVAADLSRKAQTGQTFYLARMAVD